MGPVSRVAALAICALPFAALAEVRSGQTVVVAPGEVVEGNLYAAGSTVSVLGTVTGDVVAVANTLDVRGSVGGDVLALAGNVTVSGPVQGSVRAGGGQVNVLGQVGKDGALAGGEVEVGRSARIAGDLLAAGSTTRVNGPVGGDLWAAADQLAVGSSIEGSANVRANQLRLTEGARIGGDLDYASEKPATLSPGAAVGGAVHREAPAVGPGQRAGWFFLFWLRALVATFALGLVVVLGFPAFTRRSLSALRAAPAASLGLGAAAVIGTPIAALVVFVVGLAIGGWWLAMLLLALYAAALAVCFPVVALFVGGWLFDRLRQPGAPRLAALLVGVVILTLLMRVPVLGVLVVLATVLFGLGAMIMAGVQGRRLATA